MNTRMEKYAVTSENDEIKTRTSKNKRLYDSLSSIDVDYIDINNNVLEIPLDRKDVTVKTREDYQKYKSINPIIENNNEKVIKSNDEEKQERIYDINEILERAKKELKEDKSKKRLINTEYNILTKLDIEEFNNSKELKEEQIKEIVDNLTPKKEEDNNKELFEDLKEKTVISKISQEDIKEAELTKEILEKEPEDVIKEKDYTKTKDVLDTTTDTEIIKLENKSRTVLVSIIVLVIVLLLIGSFFVLKYFDII